jgi:molybdenum cofactor guanylyltransferase
MTRGRSVTTVILAGGQGTRMGGDKALRALRGRPLIEWVIGALRGQGADIVISANAHAASYAPFGYPVLADAVPGYAGPLAGVHAAMRYSASEWVASVPCDTPFLPHDLIERLLAAAQDGEAAVAVAQGRRHPTIAIYRRRVLPRLDHYLAQGERRVGDWLRLLHARDAVFDDGAAFININSPEDLDAANRVRP